MAGDCKDDERRLGRLCAFKSGISKGVPVNCVPEFLKIDDLSSVLDSQGIEPG